MVTVNEAKQKIIANFSLLEVEKLFTGSASGFVLAADVIAPVSLPSFRQSSMDGYAIIHSDLTHRESSLKVVGESKAGEKQSPTLKTGEAVRIFTGAPVPDEATAVVMQEHTTRESDFVSIREYPVPAGLNVRNVGQQITEGQVALAKSSLLTAGAIGFLTGMNVEEVSVYKKPRIGILVTGDELVNTGGQLDHGQVYESNSVMLRSALNQEGIFEIEIRYAADDLTATIDSFKDLSANNDAVLASGGVSVGDYDYVGKALESIGAETVFYKVKQKPGKPLLFAKKNETLFFALPGNPASSLVCFYEYVLPALRAMTGRQDYFLRSIKLPMRTDYSFNGERDEFLKATAGTADVMSLEGQESFALRSFAVANAIIYLPANQNSVKKGDLVEVHLLPG